MKSAKFRGIFFVLVCLFGISLLGFSYANAETLRDSVISAIKTNPSVKSMQYARDATHYEVRQAWGAYLPRVDATLGGGTGNYSNRQGRLKFGETGYRPEDESDWMHRWQGSLVATQLICDGGNTKYKVRSTEHIFNSNDFRFIDSAEVVGLDAVVAYMSVIRERALVDYSKENVEVHKEILGFLSDRQKKGAQSLADVTQTEGRLALTNATLSDMQKNLEAALANYYRVTGIDAGPVLEMGNIPPAIPTSVGDTLQRIIDRNPKVAAYKEEIEAAKANIKYAESYYWPTIRGEAAMDYRDGYLNSTYFTRDMSLMVIANWNLYRGGSDLAAVRAATQRELRSQEDLRNLSETLVQQATSFWAEYDSYREQTKLYEQAVDFSQRTLEMYWQQFNVAQRSLLDVLDAQNELYNSKSRLFTSQVNERIAAYRLLTLCGELALNFDIMKSEYDSFTPGPGEKNDKLK